MVATLFPTMQKRLLWFSRIALGGLVIFELLNEFNILHFTLDFSWFGLAITSIIIWAFLEIAKHQFAKGHTFHFHFGSIFVVSAIMIYIDALGDILHLYSRYSHYDQVAHFIGGVAIGIICTIIIRHLQQLSILNLGRTATGLFIISLTALGASLYEIEEYLEDYFRGSHRLGDGPDTANDIMLGLIGATVVVIIVDQVLKYRSKNS